MVLPPFGFSVGDFISAISLIKNLVQALQDTAGSRPQYQRLIEALLNLKRALIEVKDLKTAPSQSSQKAALEQVASHCQHSIERFLQQNTKYESTLGSTSKPSRWSWRTDFHKMQWALCNDDSVARLRAELTAHTLMINTLLATLQLSTTFIQEERAKVQEEAAFNHRLVSDDTNSTVHGNEKLLKQQAVLIATLSHQIASFSMNSTKEMGAMAGEMNKVASNTKQETTAMKIITLLTLSYLPAAFILSITGMPTTGPLLTVGVANNLESECDKKALFSKFFRKYLMITVPFTIVVFILWYMVYLWVGRNKDIKAMKRRVDKIMLQEGSSYVV